MSSGPTIFVVDDDHAVRESLQMLLEAQGFSVETYDSAQAFLEAFTTPREGVLLVDVRMPKLSGLELQARLAARQVRLPTVFITAYGDVRQAVSMMKAGAIDFIEKPFRKEEILAAIHRAIELTSLSRTKDQFTAEAKVRIGLLTPREKAVLERLLAGQQNKTIGREFGISVRTVENHRARIMEKTGVHSLSQLTRMALAAGIILLPPPREAREQQPD